MSERLLAFTHHSSLITCSSSSDDHRVAGLARVEADGDARAGEVVGGAPALFGVEQSRRLVLDAVDLVVVEDLRDRARVVRDHVEDRAFGDAPGPQQRGAALALVVRLLPLEEVADSHDLVNGEWRMANASCVLSEPCGYRPS